MLEIKNIYKTFNAGTVNEKTALNGLTLHLDDGDFCHGHRRQRRGKIHHAQRRGRCLPGGRGQHHHRRHRRDPACRSTSGPSSSAACSRTP